MKTLVLSAMMCLAAMTSTAQVITADIVNISYQSVATSNEGQYAYNVNCDDNDYITTMYVFNKERAHEWRCRSEALLPISVRIC